MNRQEYKDYLETEHWRTLRRLKIEEANQHCQLCGKGADRTTTLHVHHNTYTRFPYRELLSDLVVVCTQCHSIFHDRLPEF